MSPRQSGGPAGSYHVMSHVIIGDPLLPLLRLSVLSRIASLHPSPVSLSGILSFHDRRRSLIHFLQSFAPLHHTITRFLTSQHSFSRTHIMRSFALPAAVAVLATSVLAAVDPIVIKVRARRDQRSEAFIADMDSHRVLGLAFLLQDQWH
jgi:hypothetical protein